MIAGMKRMKVVLGLILVLAVFATARFVYFGSMTRSCIYTEEEIPLSQEVLNSKMYFVKSAGLVQNADTEFECLVYMGGIKKQIIDINSINNDPNTSSSLVTPTLQLELHPIKMYAVRKHGLTTMDSGKTPTYHLILKEADGELYQVATVHLGINEGDEYLKMVTPAGEKLLNAESFFAQ